MTVDLLTEQELEWVRKHWRDAGVAEAKLLRAYESLVQQVENTRTADLMTKEELLFARREVRHDADLKLLNAYERLALETKLTEDAVLECASAHAAEKTRSESLVKQVETLTSNAEQLRAGHAECRQELAAEQASHDRTSKMLNERLTSERTAHEQAERDAAFWKREAEQCLSLQKQAEARVKELESGAAYFIVETRLKQAEALKENALGNCMMLLRERDALRARVAELEAQLANAVRQAHLAQGPWGQG